MAIPNDWFSAADGIDGCIVWVFFKPKSRLNDKVKTSAITRPVHKREGVCF